MTLLLERPSHRDADPGPLMLVSASADQALREQVASGLRPRPEYLVLEAQHETRLLDWSQLSTRATRRGRSATTSVEHVTAALRPAREATAVLSDGEHLGIPLDLALRARGIRTPHLVIGHHLDSRAKRALFRGLGAARRIDRILVHSDRQREVAIAALGLAPERVAVLPYAVDTDFWSPAAAPAPARPTIATAGIEHRDYATLVEATACLDAHLVVSLGSLHSPGSMAALPAAWPAAAEVSFAPPVQLRQRYAEATVVVVPVLETEFPAGITTVLEAMSMGRPVVVSGTRGMRGIVRDGVTGLVVPPGDPGAVRRAVTRLLDDPSLRRRLGAQARAFAVGEADVDRFAAGIAGHLEAISRPPSPERRLMVTQH